MPGWTEVENSCYLYVGGPVTHTEARRFCTSHNASLPLADQLEYALSRFVATLQYGYHWRWTSLWVSSYREESHDCTFLRDQQLFFTEACDSPAVKRPFICERDPSYEVS